MSRTTQKKFFDRLEALVTGHGFDLRVDYEWGNVGTGYIESPDSLNPLLTFRWAHTGNYFELKSLPVALEKADHGLHKPDGELDDLLARFDDFLANAR